MAEDEEDLSKRLSTVLDEIREVMEKRKTRIESLRQEIADIERDNEELEKTISDLLDTPTRAESSKSSSLSGSYRSGQRLALLPIA